MESFLYSRIFDRTQYNYFTHSIVSSNLHSDVINQGRYASDKERTGDLETEIHCTLPTEQSVKTLCSTPPPPPLPQPHPPSTINYETYSSLLDHAFTERIDTLCSPHLILPSPSLPQKIINYVLILHYRTVLCLEESILYCYNIKATRDKVKGLHRLLRDSATRRKYAEFDEQSVLGGCFL